jgi:hypothetical protein
MTRMITRPTQFGIAILFVASVLFGCTPRKERAESEPESGLATEVQKDKAKTETKEAAQAIRDYSYAEKAEFVDKMKKELGEVEREMDRLSAKVDSSGSAAKTDAKQKLEAVRAQWTKAKEQLAQAESATQASWSDVRDAFKESYGTMHDSFDKTRQWLSDKIEP